MPSRHPPSKLKSSSKPRSASKGRNSNPGEHESAGAERLQKVLAAAGVGSRRDCEELILEGRVEVDGEIVQVLGTRVDPLTQRIRIDGTTLPAPRRVYYLLNKPPGILCTNHDPSGRVRAVDLIRSDERLFTVGRLDQASEGLIILTNDGELANQLTHPRYGIEKVYRVRVAGTPDPSVLAKLKRGIRFADGFAKVSAVRIKGREKQSTVLEIVLNEGRNREIRRLLARIGHKVLNLTRIAMGPLRLAELPSGAHRPLTREEIKSLRHAATSTGPEVNQPKDAKSIGAQGRARTGKPKPKPKVTRSLSSAAAAKPAKTKHPESSLSDEPMSGAILGGDEAPSPQKRITGARAGAHGARKPKTGKPGRKGFGHGKPPKKGRR